VAKGQRHHYIPEFYLKQWCSPAPNGQLYEYCRRYQGVVARPTYPSGTGYAHNLYTFNKLSDENRDFLENKFFLISDNKANSALQNLLRHDLNLSNEQRSGWSRFLMTLRYRNPEAIQRLQAKIASELPSTLQKLKDEWELARRESDPRTFEEYAAAIPEHDIQQAHLMLLRSVMDSKNVGEFLNGMVWNVSTFDALRYPILTSDRPCIMTNGINVPNGHLVLPISPNTIFVSARDKQTMNRVIQEINRKDMHFGEKMNDLICRQSFKFVWGTTNRQLNFVSKRIGKRLNSA
jgi:hypothetical protein